MICLVALIGSYGWELFNYVSEARKASLGNATVAYNFDSHPHLLKSMLPIKFHQKNFSNPSISFWEL